MITPIFVDPEVTDEVIRVNGRCYHRVGASAHSPNVSSGEVQAEYDDCNECNDPCNAECCQSMYVEIAQVSPGVTVSSDETISFSGGDSYAAGSGDTYSCEAPSITIITREVSGKWTLTFSAGFFNESVFSSKGTTDECPPMGPENWEFISTADPSHDYILWGLFCCDDVDTSSPPDNVLVDRWQLLQPNTTNSYTGAPNFPLWDGVLTQTSPGSGVWLPGGSTGPTYSTIICPDSRNFDIFVYGQWSGPVPRSMAIEIRPAGVAYTYAQWISSHCHPWYGNVWLFSAPSFFFPATIPAYLIVGAAP